MDHILGAIGLVTRTLSRKSVRAAVHIGQMMLISVVRLQTTETIGEPPSFRTYYMQKFSDRIEAAKAERETRAAKFKVRSWLLLCLCLVCLKYFVYV